MQMKQSMLLMAGLAMTLASCQKDETISQGPSSESNTLSKSTANTIRTNLPSVFTRKVLAEEFVGNTYGDVPMSNAELADLTSTFNGSVYVASFHDNDMLETVETDQLKGVLQGSSAGFPTACINRTELSGSRFISFGDYSNMVGIALQTPAECGIAITSKINGSTANVKIMTGFNSTMLGIYTMNVYIVEDMITDRTGMLAQNNNFDQDKNTPFYQQGNPINGYTHNNVVRKVLTPINGNQINQQFLVPGGIAIEDYSFDIPSNMNPSNCHIIAFVTMLNSNGVADNICNVQKAKLGSVKSWN